MLQKTKKAQEEIAGFVIIVVLVSILFVVFLGISMNNPKTTAEKNSKELSSYLNSLREFTTECTIDNINYASIKELISYCHLKKTCASEENSCKVLNQTLKAIFNATKPYGPQNVIKGYFFKAEYNSPAGFNETFLSIPVGNCASDYSFAEGLLAELPGTIRYSFKECY